MLTIEEIQAELQEEIDLCNKYFIEEDMYKESTEHERLAIKIATMCMQTLSALKDGELEDYKHIKQWKSDVVNDFCKYDVSSFEELVSNARNKAIDDFVNRINSVEYIPVCADCLSKRQIREIADQLKEGITND